MSQYLGKSLRSELQDRWSEPHRRYHTLDHLKSVLAAIDSLADRGEKFDREPVVIAAWFHDAIYLVGATNNETESAKLARAALGESVWAEEVERLIVLSTEHIVCNGDLNGAAFSDADLSILGADAKTYQQYSQRVRAEYAVVPSDQYRIGRGQVLSGILGRERIFHTSTARAEWESRARVNIAREIEDLRLAARGM